ncbi:MAG: type 1 glutamine amidotransferase, partial [Primorskyibacter sp.]
MHIGILQTGPVPDEMVAQFGQYTDRFARFLDGNGFSYTTWEVHLGDFPPAPDAAEGWLITGSRYG